MTAQDQPLSGANRIIINIETMNQAIEYWLNNIVLNQSVTVTSVAERSNDNVFEIRFTEQEGDE